ncbi:MAG: Gfo/Idh/MocA family oxidoreductase [Planctomycetota bacterium]|nr:Gfo/Idh/MocA family oxidoreductase [Planctomycetota bacterium]
MKRRELLGAGVLAGAGLVVLRSGMLKAGEAPSEKLNIACVGVGGRGAGDLHEVASENIVALCDVNANNLKKAAAAHPKAKTYVDWRKCLDQKDIDAVVCATTDHTHAFVNVWALNRGKHVYCEKPLANSVHEARMVREAYLKQKDKIATQMGTQIHADENPRRFVELIKGGAIGTPKEVRVWCSRTPRGGNYLPAEPVPDYLNWDLWIGPSTMHPYNAEYLKGGCLGWNPYWGFGSGQIGDMGSHMMDLAYWALDLRFPTSCEAQGTLLSTDTCPQWLTAKWEHPANDWRPAVEVYWYDGGKKPGLPSKVFDRDDLFKGLLFAGDKGYLLADYDYRIIMPTKGDFTHYKSPTAKDLIPPSKGHHKEWIEAAKTDKKTLCNFDYSGALIEHNLLALVSYRLGKAHTREVAADAAKAAGKAKEKAGERVKEEYTAGKKLQWDAAALKAAGCPEADQYIQKKYREGWALNG